MNDPNGQNGKIKAIQAAKRTIARAFNANNQLHGQDEVNIHFRSSEDISLADYRRCIERGAGKSKGSKGRIF